MKLPSFSCDVISDSTSERSSSSPRQACDRKTPRCSGKYLIAESKISLTCCQRSGVIRPYYTPLAIYAAHIFQFPHYRKLVCDLRLCRVTSSGEAAQLFKLAAEPCAGRFPLSFHGRMTDAHHFGGFVDGKTAKKL